MGRLIVWNLMTLDGCFEGTKRWSLEFHQRAWGDELERLSIEQLDGASMLAFGRVTYEGMAAYWKDETGTIADAMNGLPKAVFSRTLREVDWNASRLHRDAARDVPGLKREARGDIYVFGSADLCATLLANRLVDEYRVCVVPLVLGAGTPLWKGIAEPLPLALREARPLGNGCVILRYAPA